MTTNKFQIGDFVRFVDEKIEGYITRLIDAHTVGVTDQEGFEIPVSTANITHVHGHQQLNASASVSFVEEDQKFAHEGLILAMIPAEKMSSVLHFHLINSTSYQLLVTLIGDRKGVFSGLYSGLIPAGGKVQIFTANLTELANWPLMLLSALYFTSQNIKPKPPLQYTRRFRAKDFSGSQQLIAALHQQGWQLLLDQEPLQIDPQKLKEELYTASAEKQEVIKPAEEVDLHIEKWRDDYHFLSPHEILEAQKNYFEQQLDAAVVHAFSSIIFIHGVGNGTLRQYIHQKISKHPQVQTFMDARKEKFGYGATQVFFKG